MRRTPGQRLGGGHAAEFGTVRPAGDDEAGLAEPAHQRGVGRRDRVRILQRDVAVADALSCVPGEQILDQERHAAKRPVGQVGSGSVAGVLEPANDHRVEHRVDALYPLDGRVEQLERRHLTIGHQRGLIDGVHPPRVIG